MNLRRAVFAILFLIIGLSFLFFILPQKNKCQNRSHCVQIPISFFPFPHKPLIRAEIEKKNYTLMLDTGSSHDLDLQNRVLEKIQNKTAIEVPRYCDVQGNRYSVRGFTAPPIKIHPLLEISGATIFEESLDFLMNGTNAKKNKSLFWKIRKHLELSYVDGRAGWPLLSGLICLFDFHNSSLFLAQTIEALEAEIPKKPDKWSSIPFELSKCGPVLSLQTNIGTRKFLLDTGTSHSLYRAIPSETNNSISLSIEIGSCSSEIHDLLFYPITAELQKDFDGVLGIDFFKSHRICLNFQDKKAYIERAVQQ